MTRRRSSSTEVWRIGQELYGEQKAQSLLSAYLLHASVPTEDMNLHESPDDPGESSRDQIPETNSTVYIGTLSNVKESQLKE